MELDEDEDTLMFNNSMNEIIFEKGLMLDIKVTDDHGDDRWTTGTICAMCNNIGVNNIYIYAKLSLFSFFVFVFLIKHFVFYQFLIV